MAVVQQHTHRKNSLPAGEAWFPKESTSRNLKDHPRDESKKKEEIGRKYFS